jgi:hypothetical protein
MRTIKETIAASRGALVDRLLARVSKALFAEGLSHVELLGRIPELIDSLGEDRLGPARLTSGQHELLEDHLAHRLRQGATLNEILVELSSLSRLLTQVVDEAVDRPSTRDTAAVLGELNLACVAAMKIFNEQMLEDEQPVKRSLRLLDRMTAEDGKSLPHSQALSLIAKAIGARSVALLLLDLTGGRAIVSATVEGGPAPAFEQYLQSIETPVVLTLARVADQAARLPVGIRSVLAIRLSSVTNRDGAFYVGLSDRDGLTSSETRTMETLVHAMLCRLDRDRVLSVLAQGRAEELAERRAREQTSESLARALHGPLAAARAGAFEIAQRRPADPAVVADRLIGHLDLVAEMLASLLDDAAAPTHGSPELAPDAQKERHRVVVR